MNASSSAVLGFDDFLKYSSGGGGGYLKNWKEDGSIDIWPHAAAGVAVRWAHSFWQIQKVKGKGGVEEEEVRSYRWICHERKVILQKQRFRDDDIGGTGQRSTNYMEQGIVGNGRREYPPEVCPMCLLNELLRDQVRAGRLDFLKPLFVWDLNGGESEVISIGGFCGLYQKPKAEYSPEQWAAMMKAGVEQSESFMENATARSDFLLRAVADDTPDEGIVIAPVADSLGRKIQKAYKDRIESSKGAFVPSRDPMCLRLKFDDSKDFEKKYDVVALIEAKPSPEIAEALASEPPSITELVTPGNVATLRAQMEKHCVLKGLPWDSVFRNAEAVQKTEAEVGPGNEPWDQQTKAPDRTQVQVPATAPVTPQAAQAPVAPKPDPVSMKPDGAVQAAEEFECDVCNGPNSNAEKCRHCGAEYDGFTGALTFDPTKPVGPSNKPREQPAAATAPAPTTTAEQPPPAGKPPGRRRQRAAG